MSVFSTSYKNYQSARRSRISFRRARKMSGAKLFSQKAPRLKKSFFR